MSYERTITAPMPKAASGRTWLATALLEAPDANGQPGEWEAIEATEGAFEQLATRHAVHEDGWYRLQWYDDGQVSRFSKPVQANDPSGGRLR